MFFSKKETKKTTSHIMFCISMVKSIIFIFPESFSSKISVWLLQYKMQLV